MKATRLSLLLLLLVLVIATPEAFAKKKGSTLSSSGVANRAAACDWFDIDCGDGTGDECCGSVDSCLAYCDETCGVSPGTCEYVE